MKKSIFILAASVVIFGISSCDKAKSKIDELTEFDIAYSNTIIIPATSFTVPSTTSVVGTPTANIDQKTADIPTNGSTNFSSNKTSGDLVSEIKMTKFNISVSSGNLDFLKSVSLYMNATGLSEVKIGSKATVAAGQTTLALDMTDANIKDYIKKDNISFRVTAVVQAAGQTAQTLKMDETVHVKATLTK